MDLFNDASLVFEHTKDLKKDGNVDLEYAVYRMRILAKFIGLWPSFSEHYTTFKAIIQKIKVHYSNSKISKQKVVKYGPI